MFRSCITYWKAIPVTYISLQYAPLPKTPLQPHPSHDGMHPLLKSYFIHTPHWRLIPYIILSLAPTSFAISLCLGGSSLEWTVVIFNTSTLFNISPSCCSCNGKPPFPCCFLLPSCWRWPWIGTKTPAAVVLWEVAGLSCLYATQGKNPADTVCRGLTGCPCSLWCHRSASHHSRDAEHLPSSHMPPARTTETSVRNYKTMSLC